MASVARPVALARCPVQEPAEWAARLVALDVDPAWGPDEQVQEFEAWADTGPSRPRRDTQLPRRFVAATTIGASMDEIGTPDIPVPGSPVVGLRAPRGVLVLGRMPQVTAVIPRQRQSITTTATT